MSTNHPNTKAKGHTPKATTDMGAVNAHPQRPRRRERYGHWPVVVLVVLFAVASMLSLVGSVKLVNRLRHGKMPTLAAPTPTADQSKFLNSSQPVERDSYKLEVLGVARQLKPDPAFNPDPDMATLVVDVRLTNKSAGPQQLIPATQFYVRTRDGDVYILHASMYVTKQLPAEFIEGGQSVTGQLSFAVPKALTNPLVYVDLGWDNATPAVIDILK